MCPEPRRISVEDAEILQELMNIAFGKAAADLAQVIDLFVALSVPRVALMPAAELPRYVRETVTTGSQISTIRQTFLGPFRGKAFLVLPTSCSNQLLAALSVAPAAEPASIPVDPCEPIDLLERETLIEVGNIVIGACLGKLSELLGAVLSYTPPTLVVHDSAADVVPVDSFDPKDTAVVLQTLFCFSDQGTSGHVFLVISQESAEWLKAALADFVATHVQG